MSLIEHSGRWLGTTSTADYVPVTVDTIPSRDGNVVYGFLVGQPLNRINRASLPAGTEVIGEELGPLHFRYTVSTPEKFRLRLFLFQFPGWTVTVDGEPVEPELGRPEGFIVIPVLSGAHVVEVRFRDTPPRQLAWSITALSLLLLGLVSWRTRSHPVEQDEPAHFGREDWWVVGMVLVDNGRFPPNP